jgi:hypothetical protein
VCELSIGTCFYVPWEEVSSSTIITHASMVLHPTCGDSTSVARLERTGRNHLAALQSIPVEIRVTESSCQPVGYLDLVIEETSVPNEARR